MWTSRTVSTVLTLIQCKACISRSSKIASCKQAVMSGKHILTAKQTARCSAFHWLIQLRQGCGQKHVAVRAGRDPAVSSRVGLCPAPSSLHAGHITQMKVSSGSCIPQGFCHNLHITAHIQLAHVAHDWRTLTWHSYSCVAQACATNCKNLAQLQCQQMLCFPCNQ